MQIIFTHPHYLLLLSLLPILIMLHFFLLKTRRNDAIKFANFEAIARIKGVDLYSKNVVIVSLTGLIVVAIILSLAGISVQREVSSSAHSFVIAIDASQSMEANDISPSRIEAAKAAAKLFAKNAPEGTRIAVMSFSGNSFIEQELTIEEKLVEQGLDSIQLSTIGGTDPAEAIISATNVLALEDGKAMILISDGRINVGNFEEAIDYASKNNVIIHTIGMGTEAGGQTSYGISTLEEESLKSAAYSTGGQYFRADSAASLSESFEKVLEFKRKKVSFDMSRNLLSIALALVMLQYILVNTRYRTYP